MKISFSCICCTDKSFPFVDEKKILLGRKLILYDIDIVGRPFAHNY